MMTTLMKTKMMMLMTMRSKEKKKKSNSRKVLGRGMDRQAREMRFLSTQQARM